MSKHLHNMQKIFQKSKLAKAPSDEDSKKVADQYEQKVQEFIDAPRSKGDRQGISMPARLGADTSMRFPRALQGEEAILRQKKMDEAFADRANIRAMSGETEEPTPAPQAAEIPVEAPKKPVRPDKTPEELEAISQKYNIPARRASSTVQGEWKSGIPLPKDVRQSPKLAEGIIEGILDESRYDIEPPPEDRQASPWSKLAGEKVKQAQAQADTERMKRILKEPKTRVDEFMTPEQISQIEQEYGAKFSAPKPAEGEDLISRRAQKIEGQPAPKPLKQSFNKTLLSNPNAEFPQTGAEVSGNAEDNPLVPDASKRIGSHLKKMHGLFKNTKKPKH